MTNQNGFLIIFSDVKPEDETDYLHWLTREHTQERLGISGFLAARVFRAEVEGAARFLILYRLSGPEIVGGEEYLARLNAPSEWSRRIMPRLSNFVRGGGRIVQESGHGEGTYIVPVIFDTADIERYRKAANQALTRDRIVAVRLFQVDQTATTLPTQEKSMRQGDSTFEAMLLLEGLDEKFLKAPNLLPGNETGSPAIYRQVFALRAGRD